MRSRLQALWRGRAASELKAAQVFSSFSVALERHGFASLQRLSERGVADECRHVDLCRTLAGDDTSVVSLAAPADWSRAALIGRAVSFCCITETLNTTLLHASVEVAEDTASAEALRSILKDEVAHARLGWAIVKSCAKAELESVGASLYRLLRETVSYGTLAADTDEARARVASGEPLPSTRRDVIASTVEQVVLPGLAQCGVEVSQGHSWLADFRAHTPSSVHGHRPHGGDQRG